MASAREKFLRIARFESTGELMLPSLWQWFWSESLVRWQNEGMPAGVHIQEYFDFERMEMIPIDLGVVPSFEVETLEEDATHKVIRDGDGAKKRVLKEHRGTSMDQWIEYPVKDRKTWEAYKKRLDPHSPIRYPLWWEEKKEEYKHRGYPLGISVGSFFGWTRNWIGIENLSYLTMDNPALIEEIGEYLEYFIIETIKSALSEIQFDFAHFWEDMAWNRGSLVSLEFVRKYMVPHYKKVTDLLHSHGIDIITLDSDGDVNALIPIWLDCGINGILPNEVAAHMDVVQMRKRFGKDLIIGGGIDKRVLAGTRKQIKEEVMNKVPYVLSTGGFFPGVDHAVPPDVPFENYLYYLELLRKVADQV
jgi:uroporphyrinogen decarboxylase